MSDALPSWYHGKISRADAEEMLKQRKNEEGVFLIRNASQGDGFVLSSVQEGEITHFQIRTEKANGREFLTFDTESSQGPLFRTLAGVVHYLLNTPNLLPVALTEWIPCEKSSIGGGSSERKVYQSLTDALCDSLAEQGAVYAEPVEYAANNPDVLGDCPSFKVTKSCQAFHRIGDVIRIVKTEVDDAGSKILVCENQKKQCKRIPYGTPDVQLVPFRASSIFAFREQGADGQAPPLPRRDIPIADEHGTKGYHQFKPLNHQKSAHAFSTGEEVMVYREMIMEGYLQKLPPLGNTFRGWKRRWFRLVIVISSTRAADGPIALEYYDKPESSVAKGVINLGRVQKISRVDPEDERVRLLSKVDSSRLFKIVLKDRTYPLLAESSSLVGEWLKTLNETLGLTETGAKEFVAPPIASGESEYTFQARILKGHNAADGFACTLILQPSRIFVKLAGTDATLLSWYYSELCQYGYVKQILWIKVTMESQFSGITCFSTPDAEAIWTLIRDRLRQLDVDDGINIYSTGGERNMRWGSRGENDRKQIQVGGKLITRVVFGETIIASELENAGIAVVKKDYRAQKDNQMTLKKGEIYPILSCQVFKKKGQGGFLLTSPAQNRFALIKESCVQVHEHEFSSLEDDDLLDGVDTSIMAPLDGYAVPAAVSNGYEVPVPVSTSSTQSVPPGNSDVYEYADAEEIARVHAAALRGSREPSDSHDYVNASMDYINAEAIQAQQEEIVEAFKKKMANSTVEYVNANVVGDRTVQREKGVAAGVDYANAAALHDNRTPPAPPQRSTRHT